MDQKVVSRMRLELITYGLEDRCSVQLSYREINSGANRETRTLKIFLPTGS